MTRALLSVIALLMSIGLANARSEPTIEIYEYGTYTLQPGVVIGLTRRGMEHGVIDHIDLVQSTETVVGHVGNRFGFRYRVDGVPLGTRVPLTLVMRFPAPGMVTKGGSAPFLDDELAIIAVAGIDSFRTWTFEERSDIVPGLWVFEIWHGKKKIAEQNFTVILPPIA